jgi:hypothetical protein
MALRTVRESTYPLVTVDAGLASVLSIASPLEVEDIKVFGDGSCAGLGRVVAGDVVNKVRTDPPVRHTAPHPFQLSPGCACRAVRQRWFVLVVVVVVVVVVVGSGGGGVVVVRRPCCRRCSWLTRVVRTPCVGFASFVPQDPLPPFRASMVDGYAVVAADGVGKVRFSMWGGVGRRWCLCVGVKVGLCCACVVGPRVFAPPVDNLVRLFCCGCCRCCYRHRCGLCSTPSWVK